jgi:hypothetical protein
MVTTMMSASVQSELALRGRCLQTVLSKAGKKRSVVLDVFRFRTTRGMSWREALRETVKALEIPVILTEVQ